MGKNIQLFSGYSQQENRTTNYCMLILKMLYEENPKFLGQLLSSLINEFAGNSVGVKFKQQSKKKHGIPDGVIAQDSFTIYVEAKNYDWFYDEQLENHLKDLNENNSGIKILLALSNFEGDTDHRFTKITELCQTEYKNIIIFKAISFEDLINAIDNISQLSVNLKDIVADFRGYLDEENSLPTWKNWLDVINCSINQDSILDNKIYFCPASGGQYRHTRCKYFGMYSNKKVERVADIIAVVDLNSPIDSEILWNNSNEKDDQIKVLSRVRVANYHPLNYPLRVFILGDLFKTNFVKTSKGGLWGSKMYFDISELNVKNSEELANELNNITWDDFLEKYHAKYHSN